MRIAHIIHDLKAGGVESAVMYAADHVPDDARFCVATLQSGRQNAGIRKRNGVLLILNRFRKFNPLAFVYAGVGLRAFKPEVIVCSLWRSYIFGYIYKRIHSRCMFVLFVHNSRFIHVLDKFTTRLGASNADFVFVDSNSAKSFVEESLRFQKPLNVVSFKLPVGVGTERAGKPGLSFIFWGRLARQKGLDKALQFISEITKRTEENVSFLIIGPDEGIRNQLEELVETLSLEGVVEFKDEMSMKEIETIAMGCSFYLQLSRFEGMAMSVVEAMQMGLVPVVTAVGEITNYADHMRNAVIYQSPAGETADLVLALSRNPGEYQKLAIAARDTFEAADNYDVSFFKAVRSSYAMFRGPAQPEK